MLNDLDAVNELLLNLRYAGYIKYCFYAVHQPRSLQALFHPLGVIFELRGRVLKELSLTVEPTIMNLRARGKKADERCTGCLRSGRPGHHGSGEKGGEDGLEEMHGCFCVNGLESDDFGLRLSWPLDLEIYQKVGDIYTPPARHLTITADASFGISAAKGPSMISIHRFTS